MKKILVLAFAFAALLVEGTLSAQTLRESKLHWEAGPLMWEDFLGRPTVDSMKWQFSWVVSNDVQMEKIRKVRYYYQNVSVYALRNQSWVRPGEATPARLLYSQTVFDLWELYARKIKIEFNTSHDLGYNEVASFYSDMCADEIARLKAETKQGENEERVKEWADSVKNELAHTTFDPVAVADSLTWLHGASISMGFWTSLTASSYFAPSYGISMDFGYMYRKHLFELEIAVGGGSMKKDLLVDRDLMRDGEQVTNAKFAANWGYRLRETTGSVVYSLLGVGGGGYTYSEEYDRGRTNSISVGGVVLQAGFSIDLLCRRKIYLRGGYGRSQCDYQAVRLKPVFAFSHYGDGVGWTPAFQLAVSYNLSGRWSHY